MFDKHRQPFAARHFEAAVRCPIEAHFYDGLLIHGLRLQVDLQQGAKATRKHLGWRRYGCAMGTVAQLWSNCGSLVIKVWVNNVEQLHIERCESHVDSRQPLIPRGRRSAAPIHRMKTPIEQPKGWYPLILRGYRCHVPCRTRRTIIHRSSLCRSFFRPGLHRMHHVQGALRSILEAAESWQSQLVAILCC